MQEQLPSYDLVTQQEKEFIAVVKSVSGKDGRGIPEKEAQFQIYLKSAGSFEQARTNERDTLVCDDEGYARSKGMSQGVYVVHQERWQEGTVPAEDFEVTGAGRRIPYRSAVPGSSILSKLCAQTREPAGRFRFPAADTVSRMRTALCCR